MNKVRRLLKEKRERLHFGWHTRLTIVFTLGIGLLLGTGIASASETIASEAQQVRQFPLGQIFTFLFLMLGPFKIIGPFSKITKGADAAVIRRTAIQATVFASAALLIAAVLGERILSSYGIPLPILSLAAGIILFLVALQSIMQQFTPSHETTETQTESPSIRTAMVPLAFPTIVTPYGIATLVVFLSFSPNLQATLMICAIVLVIMLLNLIVMLLARKMMPVMSIALPILGAILGIIQVALGLLIINNSLKALGILSYGDIVN